MEQDIDSLVNQVAPGGTLTLSPLRCEFEGPVIIRKPLTLVGQQGLIWAKKGPVLRVECSGVVLQDLGVEITGHEDQLAGENACAIVVAPGLGITLNDVCVRGNVAGLPEEEGNWRYPRSLRIKVRPGQSEEFHITFTVPVPCRLVSSVAGVNIKPSNLKAGDTDVAVILDPLAAGVRVRGEISLKTAFLDRQISVMANVSASANTADRLHVVFWDSLAAGSTTSHTSVANQEASATVQPPRQPSPASRPTKKTSSVPVEQLGPGSASAQTPIPDKLTQRPSRKKEHQVSGLFNKQGLLETPRAASKVKSVPLIDLWSSTSKESASDASLPPAGEKLAYPEATSQQANTVESVQPTVGPGTGIKDATGCIGTGNKATVRSRPVLDFSAFGDPQTSASVVANEQRAEMPIDGMASPQEEMGGAKDEDDSVPLASQPRIPKSRKLRRTNGSLDAFGSNK